MPNGQQVRELPSEAITDRTDFTRAGGVASQMGQRGGEILDALVFVKVCVELKRTFPFLVNAIGKLDARLVPPEKIGTHHDESFSCEPIGDVAHRLVDAEDFLNENNAGTCAASGEGCVGFKRAAFDCVDGGHGHFPDTRNPMPMRFTLSRQNDDRND